MRTPDFWWRKPGLAAAALAPLAALYGAVAASRMARPGWRCPVPVVCIGNFTLGGAGKTPTALAVAAWLREHGEHPFFLTRGYGGRLAGPVTVGDGHTAADVGDEALLLARTAPTIVARDRRAGAAAAQAAGASVLVMDDGFQNPSLVKDVALLVVDARRGIGNGRVFPAGPLRAPFATQLERAGAVLVIGEGAAAGPVRGAAAVEDRPVFAGALEPDPQALAALAGRPVLAFAGIGDPEKFFATLRQNGIDVSAARAFPDHHRFETQELAALADQARAGGLTPVTTEKDLVRLGRMREAVPGLVALPVRLVSNQAEALRAFIADGIAAARS